MAIFWQGMTVGIWTGNMSFKVDKSGDVMCIPIQALDTWQVKDKIEFFGDYEIEWFVEVPLSFLTSLFKGKLQMSGWYHWILIYLVIPL